MTAGAGYANWQYPGTYVGDGVYTDDGSRFVISVRGGASMGFASIKNEMGALTAHYWTDGVEPFSELLCGGPEGCAAAGYEYLGYGNVGSLHAADDFSETAFAAGASIGWTIPNRPQWRLELGWDHIGEMEYNAAPLFRGDVTLVGGTMNGKKLAVESGAVQSDVKTDIISAMAFYDFFDGLQKPARTIIPYIGFGVGYADTETTLNLSDIYGDLSEDIDLWKYGTIDESTGVINFYRSEKSNSNIAGVLAAGISYGITETTFLDLGARVMYVPKIKWALSNEDDSRHRDWFSAENMIYANIMLGLRFEF